MPPTHIRLLIFARDLFEQGSAIAMSGFDRDEALGCNRRHSEHASSHLIQTSIPRLRFAVDNSALCLSNAVDD